VRGLVESGAQEAFDLDFKATTYGRREQDHRALAGDVAALANTAGGAIVIGIEEDDQARAASAPGIEITDGEVARIRQVVASLTAPMPTLDIIPLFDDEPQNERGFLVLAVPRSPGAPHAVLINEGLRYPKRNGATTRYLSEPEVAMAYRERLSGVAQQNQRILDVEKAAMARLNRDEPWVLVALVPDVTGELDISASSFAEFQRAVVGAHTTVIEGMTTYARASVGQRCLLANDNIDNARTAYRAFLQLHSDGSGAYGHRLHSIAAQQLGGRTEEEGPFLIWDELLVLCVISGLLRLARNARDDAAASGNTFVRAQLISATNDRIVEIGHSRSHGFAESRSIALTLPIEPAEIATSLDDLAQEGPPLLATAAALVDELGQAFGVTELGQLTRDGKIRRPYWSPRAWQQPLADWALQNGITVLDG